MSADSNDDVPSSSLAKRAFDAPNVWDDVRLQKLWLGLERRRWQSLAVLSASPLLKTYPVAELLAQLAWRYRGQPSGVVDLRDLSMRLIEYQAEEVRSRVAAGTRLVVALRSIFENPTAAPIAQQTDGVVVCIAIGQTTLREVEETVAAVGRDRVLGAILVRRSNDSNGA
jgi:hypothetical protein